MAAKRFLFALGLVLPVLALGQQPSQSDFARVKQLIARSMDRVPGFNVIAVVLYRDSGDGDSEQAKVEIARDGRMHRVVLQPLSREGFESVDDGKLLQTLVPDHKTILVQESPLLESSDVSYRLALIDKNYQLRVEAPLRVAGREATSILALPRHSELLPRRLILDTQTGFLLRLEVATSDGKMEPRVEVKSVSFPNSISGSIFELRTLGSARTIKFSKREYLDLNSAADLPVSFKPQVPHHLSGGFVVQNAQLNNGRFRSIAVRITDGLVKGTVYECSPADAPEMKIQSASRISTADIVFTLVMDAPGDLRDRILKAFAKSGRPNRGPGNSRPGTAPPPQDVVTSGNGAQRRVARSAPIPPKIDHP